MSTSTRRERDRAAVRDRIVTVALAILEREGATALTIRRIAGEVEYTAPVVYQHFVNKDALLVALVRLGFGRLRTRMADAAEAAATIEERVLDTGRAYLAFAGDTPHLYELMNNTAVDAHERARAATPVTELVVEIITAWAAECEVTLADPMETCELVWGTMHGMANLGLLGTIGFPRATYLAEQALRALLLAWRASS